MDKQDDIKWLTKEMYDEWAKTRGQFFVNYENIRVYDNKIHMDVRVGDHDIRLGADMCGAKVLGIHAYGKDLDVACCGMTCRLILDRMPGFIVEETPPDLAEWIRRNQEKINGSSTV